MAETGYGAAGRVGVLVPSGNPTVEPEIAILLPPDVVMLTARMASAAASMNERLVEYGRMIDRWMAAFGGMELDAIAFACTGTSYLMEKPVARSWADGHGGNVPFVSAAAAVEDMLTALAARRIALVSPYAADLTEAAVSYWRSRGFAVSTVAEIAPPSSGYHPIYVQTASAVAEAIERAVVPRSDAVVVLGTGAPSLAAIAASHAGVPVISSNLSLGWAIQSALRSQEAADAARWLARDAPWKQRLRARFPSSESGIGHSNAH